MIKYRIDHKHNCVFVQNTGACTTEAILAHIGRLESDPDYVPGMNDVIDLCHITRFDVDTNGIRVVVNAEQNAAEILQLTKTAFVCKDDLVFGMLRMFQTLSQDLHTDIQIFKEYHQAFRFLGIHSNEKHQLDQMLNIMNDIAIRPEQTGDIEAIDSVTRKAFLNAPHADHTEHRIVKALRDSGALSISLVAEVASEIIGHVALSPVTVTDGTDNWYGLGPISVSPDEQGRGIGSLLMNAAIDALKAVNAKGCVLLGEPAFYGRFGFEVVDGLILKGVPPEYFQALLLDGEYPQGSVSYHEAFSVTS